jgi:hypothetical protein
MQLFVYLQPITGEDTFTKKTLIRNRAAALLLNSVSRAETLQLGRACITSPLSECSNFPPTFTKSAAGRMAIGLKVRVRGNDWLK